MSFISDIDKTEFEAIISDSMTSENFGSKTLIWFKAISGALNRFGEDSEEIKDGINIPCLINYNYMRSWPITQYSEAGEVNRQSMQVLISKKFLKDNGFLTYDGYFDYSPGHDDFAIDGVKYEAAGDTPASQAYTDDLLFTLILIPQLKPTRSQ